MHLELVLQCVSINRWLDQLWSYMQVWFICMQVHLRTISFLTMLHSTQLLWCDPATGVTEPASLPGMCPLLTFGWLLHDMTTLLCRFQNMGTCTAFLEVGKLWLYDMYIHMPSVLQGRHITSWTHIPRAQLPPDCQAMQQLGTCCTALVVVDWPSLATSCLWQQAAFPLHPAAAVLPCRSGLACSPCKL